MAIESDILAQLLNDQNAINRTNTSEVLNDSLSSNKELTALYKNVKDIHDYLLKGSGTSVSAALRNEASGHTMRDRQDSATDRDNSRRGNRRGSRRNDSQDSSEDYGNTVGQGIRNALGRAFSNSKFKRGIDENLGAAIQSLGGDLTKGTGNLKGRFGNAIAENGMNLIKSMMQGNGKAGLADIGTKFGGMFKNLGKMGTQFSDVGRGLGNISTSLKGVEGMGRAGRALNGLGRMSGRLSGGFEGLGQALAKAGPELSKGAGQFVGVLKGGGSVGQAMTKAGPALKAGAATLGKGALAMAKAAGPYAAIVVAAIYAIHKFKEAIAPAINGLKSLAGEAKKAANREAMSAADNVKLAKERLIADVNTLVTQPFQNLKVAADSVTSAFDNTLRVISATQGYTKSDVQNLMSSYANRLRSEGLTDIVAGSDLISNLSKVIESGLSGKVAEEFAYQATILGNAIPTQDFFGYASTYSSIAANAIRLGKSQDEAITEANKSLSDFANNLLYASRQLAGGYSTGLTNAQGLYEQSVRIAQAARSENIAGISGVMTSVAAVIGATAPDLANAITDAVYSAATGGNNSSIVALRSLAGINASNTEFLKALANNPQKIFAQLFTNLGNMFNDSSDAYMEKAQGYAELFGLSSDAFARIDFNYLAQAISDMNLSSNALNQNMELMVSGETTLTAEQLKNREINKYMLENGLSYVLDNEAARAIQQHMWDEQMAREMREATYGVDLKGAALEALTGIVQTVKNILTFLNPISALMKLTDLVGTIAEAEASAGDIQQVLMLGNVGAQNSAVLQQLTTRNADLGLYNPLVDQLGGRSMYSAARAGRLQAKEVGLRLGSLLQGNPVMAVLTPSDLSTNSALSSTTNPLSNASLWAQYGGSSKARSGYTWSTVGKSTSNTIKNLLSMASDFGFGGVSTARKGSAQNHANSVLKALIGESESVEELAKKAKAKGISNLSEALEEMGSSESEVSSYYETKQTQAAALEAEKAREIERQYYEMGLEFFQTKFPEDFQTPLFEALDIQHKTTESLLKNFVDYFINHLYYDDAMGGSKYYKQVLKVQKEEKSQKGDAIYALAEAITANSTDLRDPAVQTNALLSEILLVLNAIMQQNNTGGAASGLAETLAALAMGGTYKTK